MSAVILIMKRELVETFGIRGTFLRVALFVIGIPIAITVLSIRPAVMRDPTDAGRIVQIAGLFLLQFGLMPLGSAMVGAATSFAVEFESRTLTPLLVAPVATGSIFWGKFLAALLTGAGMAWMAQIVFVLTFRPITGLSWPLSASGTVAAAAFILLVGLPLMAAATIAGSRARRVRVAQQYGSLVFLAVLLAVLFGFSRVPSNRTELIPIAVGGTVAITVSLLILGVKMWDREELLGRP